METFLVYFFGGLKLVFTLVLLFGWIIAWRFKSKGGGKLLWIIYCICVVIAAASMLLFQDQFSRNDTIREWFMSDQGFIAWLNGGRGLSFPAAESISLVNGIQIMGMLFCIMTLYFWISRLKMSPQNSSSKSEVQTEIVRKIKKYFRWIFSLILIFVVIIIYWKYFYSYSEGYRAGLLQKFSHKGAIFKTYEGEIILSSVSSTRDVALASEKFLFSVTNKSIVRQFDTLQGRTVIVHYRQKNSTVFWRGDSPYLVDSVKVRR